MKAVNPSFRETYWKGFPKRKQKWTQIVEEKKSELRLSWSTEENTEENMLVPVAETAEYVVWSFSWSWASSCFFLISSCWWMCSFVIVIRNYRTAWSLSTCGITGLVRTIKHTCWHNLLYGVTQMRHRPSWNHISVVWSYVLSSFLVLHNTQRLEIGIVPL